MLEFAHSFVEIGATMLGQVQASNMCNCYFLTGPEIGPITLQREQVVCFHSPLVCPMWYEDGQCKSTCTIKISRYWHPQMSGMKGIQSVHDPLEHRFTLGTGTFYMLHDSDLFWRAFQDLKWFLLHHVFMYWSTRIIFIEPIPILLHWHCHIANVSWPLPSSLLVFLLGS